VSGFYEPPSAFSSPFRDRLLRPNWELIAAALGRQVPGILRDLYGNPDNILRAHFKIERPEGESALRLDLFLPMDQEALHPYDRALPPGAVAFADDERGDPYFFVPDDSERGDGPVFVLQQQRGTDVAVPVAPSLSTFLHWPRRHTYQDDCP
jgi:hypothetical protein